jgi:hypothetical protein
VTGRASAREAARRHVLEPLAVERLEEGYQRVDLLRREVERFASGDSQGLGVPPRSWSRTASRSVAIDPSCT